MKTGLRRRAAVPILVGGFVAGTLDMAFACGFWALKADVPAQRIFQSVARGLLGPRSYEGGAMSAALGLFLHYGIETAMSATYYFAARRLTPLRERPLTFGAVYGLALYAVMTYVVVPLSAAGKGSRDPLWVALSVAAHVFLVGIPIAVTTNRALSATRG